MSKKALIALFIGLFLVLVGIGVAFYYQSFKNVHFDFKNDDLAIDIYEQKDKERQTPIATLSSSSDIRLQAGKYVFVPNGDIYNPLPIDFEVRDRDVSIDVNPDYSSTYRKSLLQAELPAIKAAINAKYPSVIGDFTIDDGEIFKEGQWYATILTQKTPSLDQEGDIYRIVLKKENGKWIVKVKPALVLSSKEYPDIPKEILSGINARRAAST